ncbi:MAG TPA: class I SAM-dependent methyltransferase [Chryseosolibacter sp.]
MNEFNVKSYWNSRLQNSFGLEAVGYIGLGKRFNEWMYRLRSSVFRNLIAELQLKLPQLRVLDIGSGSGFYIAHWTKLGAKSIMGIDISTQAVKNLSSQYPAATFVEADISEVKIPGKFQVISCMDVLFHVTDDHRWKQALNNILEALDDNGVFIFSDNFLNGPEKRQAHHVSRSLSQYERTLKEAGFVIKKRIPAFYFLNYPVDSKSRMLHFVWKGFLRFIPGRERLGYLCGLFFYGVDRILLPFVKSGPSTEIMVCEKRR